MIFNNELEVELFDGERYNVSKTGWGVEKIGSIVRPQWYESIIEPLVSKDQVFKARFSIIRNIANYEIDVTLTNVNRDIYIYERNGRITGDRKSRHNVDKTEMKSRGNNSTNPVVRIHH